MARFKDADWNLRVKADGSPENWETVQVAALMDIRDELKSLNALLHCHNFVSMPSTLRAIQRNTVKKRAPKRRAKP